MPRFKVRLLLVLVTSLFVCVNAYGATVDSLQIIGSPNITETDICTVSRIPDAVIDLFHAKGGHILFVSSPLEYRYGAFTPTVYGLYHESSHRIYIRNGSEVGYVLAHELGHFLFHETRPSWAADIRERFTDTEEFAEVYATYCVYGTADAAINSIHMTVEKLSERGKL